MTSPALIKGGQLAIRASVAAGLSFAIARILGLEYPLYAFIAAVIVSDLAPAQTRQLGWRRLVATVVGATSGAALCHVLPAGPWAIGFGVLIAMLACTLIRMQEGAKVAGYISGIVLSAYSADPWTYATYRLLETILGVVVAWSISHLPKLVRIDEPAQPGA